MANKGGSFEREVSKTLSRWWTDNERDDIFWRSTTSGGTATRRWHSLKKLGAHGHGDIIAIDPVGNPLIEMFSIECKKGYRHISPFDVIEQRSGTRLGVPALKPVDRIIIQAATSAVRAQSRSWLWIHGRLQREVTVTTDGDNLQYFPRLEKKACLLILADERPPLLKFGIRSLATCTLANFLDNVSPNEIRKVLGYHAN